MKKLKANKTKRRTYWSVRQDLGSDDGKTIEEVWDIVEGWDLGFETEIVETGHRNNDEPCFGIVCVPCRRALKSTSNMRGPSKPTQQVWSTTGCVTRKKEKAELHAQSKSHQYIAQGNKNGSYAPVFYSTSLLLLPFF
jgi:hypothetical protein